MSTPIRTSPLLLLPLYMILTFAITADSLALEEVRDVANKKLISGLNYYILPVMRGTGGGLTLGPNMANHTCPLDVVQHRRSEASNGLPVTFRPVKNLKKGTVYDEMSLQNGFLRLQPKGGHGHHNGEENESPSNSCSSLGRKVGRSRSVGCGSRSRSRSMSFSGDFLERLSTGFGDCTVLRRVESHREASKEDNHHHHHRHPIKDRVKCGGLFEEEVSNPYEITTIDRHRPLKLLSAQTPTSVWKLASFDEEVRRYFVTTGGREGSPGIGSLSNWFKIEKDGEDYKLSFCPSVCKFCKVICKDVGIYVDGEGVRRLALSDETPFNVMFKKA
ncbi:hypothetical protein Syun_026378 [Stephania yunnanensis]|uniref:Uncharacterized protein n=1 Tax=Stephania yunnanensis TaxID=152371 RepID=A0AAP0EYY8_9MAGN